jgi:hypothetical protein
MAPRRLLPPAPEGTAAQGEIVDGEIVDGVPAPERDDSHQEIARALAWCKGVVSMSRLSHEARAILGIAGVGALSLLALRGSVSLPDLGRRRNRNDEPPPRASDLDEIEALGRVIASEVEDYSLKEKVAVAWAVRNRARREGKSIARLVCSPRCGPQRGRPFSSARPANDETRQIAAVVLHAPQDLDPTGGAVEFFEPILMDRLYRKGLVNYSATGLREKWRSEGKLPYGSVGRVELWGRKDRAS